MAKRKMTAKYRSKADARRDMKRRRAKKKKGKGAQEMESVETTFLTTRSERLVFWILMITMIFVMLTHISLLFHEVRLVPQQIDQNTGWAKFGVRVERMAHFYGLLAFGFALVLVILWWLPRALSWHAYDAEWMSQLGGYGRKGARVPPAGRFNPEQKIATLGLIIFGLLYVLSGVVQEMPKLVGENITLVRTSYSLHAFCLVALGFVALMHVYLAAFSRPGGMGAIWSGKVPKKYAETHYSIWFEKSLESTKIKAEKDRRRHEKYVDMEKERIAKIMAKRKARMKGKKGAEAELEEAEIMEAEVLMEPGEEMEVQVEAEEVEFGEGEHEEAEYVEGEYEEGEYEEGEYEEGEYEEGEYEEGEYDEEAFQEDIQDSEAFDLEPVEGEEEEREE
jgi:formate dehydrogenase gamma subunit